MLDQKVMLTSNYFENYETSPESMTPENLYVCYGGKTHCRFNWKKFFLFNFFIVLTFISFEFIWKIPPNE